MPYGFLSIGVRYLINLHALNNEGTAGNITRVRRVPYIIRTENGYQTIQVNVISGQSIAHAIQAHIADLGVGKVPICEHCARHVFVKSGSKDYMPKEIENLLKPSQAGDLSEQIKQYVKAEEALIKNCAVEDIGGFLVAATGLLNIKRESTFHVSFIAPIFDYSNLAYIESLQFARHEPVQAAKKKKEEEAREAAEAQMIFVQEVAGGIYGMRLDFNYGDIGHSLIGGRKKVLDDDQIKDRLRIALEAIKRTIGYAEFGAKRSRFLPIQELLEAVFIVSDGIPVSSPFTASDFFNKTKRRAEAYKKLGGAGEVFYYRFDMDTDFEEVFSKVVEFILSNL